MKNIIKSKSAVYEVLLCFVSGAFTVLSYEPFAWYGVVFISLAILCFLLQRATSKLKAFLLGTAYGLGLFTVGVSWVYVSLSTYGGMPLWMGIIAVLLFSSALATYIGLVGVLQIIIMPKPGAIRLIVIPPCWVTFEWLKGWLFTGFPWLDIGYTQTPSWFFALAPLGGVYLISFVVISVACLLVLSCLSQRRWLSILSIVALFSCSYALSFVEWSKDDGRALNVAIIQANIPINLKWQATHRDEHIALYSSMSEQLNQTTNVDLFVWPETAIPVYLQQTDEEFWRSIVPVGSALLTGLMDAPAHEEVYNAATLWCEGEQQTYRKQHLVPFGEYLPLRFLFNWVLEYLQLPMSDFSIGSDSQPMQCSDGINISLSICYEDAFGAEWRRNVGDATLLVNISEDAWFGNSLAPHQRQQMAQMRARELSKPLVRSANTGPSVVISQKGRVMAKTDQFKAQTLTYMVQPQVGDTWYKVFGNWAVYCAFVYLLVVFLMVRRRKTPLI